MSALEDYRLHKIDMEQYYGTNCWVEQRHADAAIESLECCGNCDHRGGDYGDECFAGRKPYPDPPHAYRAPRNVRAEDHCHTEWFGGKSKWTERDD